MSDKEPAPKKDEQGVLWCDAACEARVVSADGTYFWCLCAENFCRTTYQDEFCLPATIAMSERIEDLEALVARMRAKLLEAAEDVGSWGAYATDYFREKWHLERNIQEYLDAAKWE